MILLVAAQRALNQTLSLIFLLNGILPDDFLGRLAHREAGAGPVEQKN